MPLNCYYKGVIIEEKGDFQYMTSDRNEFKNKLKGHKNNLRCCSEMYEIDSVVHVAGYEDYLSNLRHPWTYISVSDKKLIYNEHPDVKAFMRSKILITNLSGKK